MTRTLLIVAICFTLLLSLGASNAEAHFPLMLTDTAILPQDGDKTIKIRLGFGHPFEVELLNAPKPEKFGVLTRGQKQNLLGVLKETTKNGIRFYDLALSVKRPGDLVFFNASAPYFDQVEKRFHRFYTKIVVNAFGVEGRWDKEIGFPVEIVPTVRPYGLWTGNLFEGVVKRNGEPVPFAELEVERLNRKAPAALPAAPYITQVVRADERGRFSYAFPRAGWWAFAARFEDTTTIQHNGEDRPLESSAVMWVFAKDMD